jgi:hypothetical protein
VPGSGRDVYAPLAPMAEDRETAEVDLDSFRDGEVDVAEEDERGERGCGPVELRLSEVEVGVPEEDEREAEPRQAPAARPLGVAEDHAREAFRAASNAPGRRRGRKVPPELLQLVDGDRSVGPLRALGELLQRQPACRRVLA